MTTVCKAHVVLGDHMAEATLRRPAAKPATRRADPVAADGIIIGSSTAMAHLRAIVGRIGPSAAPVLITGPSGSGKEAVARAIHAASDRADRAFVAINCGAIVPELIESELFGHEKGSFTGAAARRIGRFEEAHGGTLFLDEIGDMRFDMQVKLLRVLEDGVVQRVGGGAPVPVDVRIVSATHNDIHAQIASGKFRQDLYFRLGVLPVKTPALAERPEDIPALIEHFQSRMGPVGRVRFDDAAMAQLQAHGWNGNVRELRNVVERGRVLYSGEMLGADAVDQLLGVAPVSNVTYIAQARAEAKVVTPPANPSRTPINLRELVETMELERIQMALDMAEGVVSEAARMLTLKRTTLIEKMRKYGVNS
jgi:sigma-54 dependent transcriptional regulator, flagellar regulatory protein